jgi:CheY-like chemotaxis protein
MIRRTAIPPDAARAGAPLVLVVEDDARTLQFILTLLRYASPALVLEASDPHGALQAAGAIGRPIDLLISDIDLSDAMTGIDLARELAARHRSMKVVLMSACDLLQSGLPPEWRFLGKPFPIAALLDCVGDSGVPVSPQWR